MRTKLNILLAAILFAFMTACGGGGMKEETLTSTKWILDVDAMEKEAKRIISKMKDEKTRTQAEQGLKQVDAFKSMIESVALDFKEDGTIALDGAENSPIGGMAKGLEGVKWELKDGKLFLEAEGKKVGFSVSGSSDAMKLTVSKDDMEALAKETGESIPADVEKEMDNVLPVEIAFKAKK